MIFWLYFIAKYKRMMMANCRLGIGVFGDLYTMRTNLQKTLDQLIFSKYTLVFSKCSQIY